MDKSSLRNMIRQSLLAMSEQDYQERSNKICNALFQEPSILEGETIAMTISVFPEVNTYPIIEKLWSMGKRVVVPKCNTKEKIMTFYELTEFNQLAPVNMGLFEPFGTKAVAVHEIDICIVPGIVFDLYGYRIGYGGGYYDRFLPTFNGKKVSIAFGEQLVNKVPFEVHDIPIELLITDTQRLEKDGRGLLHEKYD